MDKTLLAVRGVRPHQSSDLILLLSVVVVLVALIVQVDVVRGQRKRGVVSTKLFIQET